MRAIAVAMRERELYENVRALALALGWLVYHTYDARRSYAGFPDVILVRPPRLVVAELKSERGRLRSEQRVWLEALAACGIETHVWRPSDWLSGAIEAVLHGAR